MHVEPQAKFSAFFLSRCGLRDDLPKHGDLMIAEGVWAGRSLGVEPSKVWRETLGTFLADEVKGGGLAVYVSAKDAPAQVKEAMDDVFNGLMLQGVPVFFGGFMVNGENVDGKAAILHVSQLRDSEPTFGSPDWLVGRAELTRAVWLGCRLRYMQDQKGREWGRLLRGVRTLLTANRESNSHGERLHQLVRSLEALVKAPKGENRKKVVHRGQTFITVGSKARDTLGELYDLRSAVEHLNVPTAVLRTGTEAERLEVLNRRTRQADGLARWAVLGILESAVMFNIFRTDAGIDEFWRLPDDKRVLLWGKRLNIETIQ